MTLFPDDTRKHIDDRSADMNDDVASKTGMTGQRDLKRNINLCENKNCKILLTSLPSFLLLCDYRLRMPATGRRVVVKHLSFASVFLAKNLLVQNTYKQRLPLFTSFLLILHALLNNHLLIPCQVRIYPTQGILNLSSVITSSSSCGQVSRSAYECNTAYLFHILNMHSICNHILPSSRFN